MTFRGSITADDAGREWTALIGKFVANYGALEYLTYLWQEALAGRVSGIFCKLSFSERIDRLIRDVQGDVRCRPYLDEIIHCWQQAKIGLITRNRVCHEPLGYVWIGREADGPPDSIAFLSYEKSGSFRHEIPKDAFSEQVDVIVKLAEKLETIRVEAFGDANS